jgi:DNA-binding YbaB/EbfC family protein
MFKNMQQMQQLLKQAQAMQERLKQQLETLSVEASAGGGMVSVTMNGNKVVTRLAIDPEVVNKEDVEMLQDLIVAAVNEASRKVEEQVQQQVAGELRLPGLF